MELFKIFGSILVDDKKAIDSLKKTDKEAYQVNKGLNAVSDAGKKIGKFVLAGATVATGAIAALTTKTVAKLDDIDKASQRAGTGAEEWQRWGHVANLNGIEMATFEKAMVRNQRAMADASKGAGKASEAYKDLGINVEGLSSDEVFEKVILNLSDMDDETHRNAIANDLFGKSFADLAPLLNNTSEEIKEQKGELDELGAVINQDTVKAGAELNDAFTRVQEMFGGVVNQIGSALIPTFQKIADWVLDNKYEIQEGFKNALDKISDAIAWVKDNVNWLIPILGTMLGGFMAFMIVGKISALFGFLKTVIGGVTAAGGLLNFVMAANPMTLVVAGITALIAIGVLLWKNWDVIVEKLTALWSTFTDRFPAIGALVEKIFNGIKNVVTAVINFIRDAIGIWINTIKSVIKIGLDVVSGIFSTVFNAIKNIVKTVMNIIEGIISGDIKGISGIIKAVLDGIKNIFSNIFGAVENIVKSVFGGIRNTISTIMSAVRQSISSITQSIKNTFVNVFGFILSFVSDMFNKMRTSISNVMSSIRNTISNITQGIKNVFSNVFGSITGVVSRIFNGIKNTISNTLTSAVNIVKNMINKIKGFFNFKWAFPKLKMPHFKVSGSMNPLQWKAKGTPKIGVDWYKDGGLMTRPTAFGMNGNNVMAGGEAGQEAILPLTSSVLGDIGKGIASTMSGSDNGITIHSLKRMLSDMRFELVDDGNAFKAIVDNRLLEVL